MNSDMAFLNGNRIIMQFPYRAELIPLIKQLPEARWDKKRRHWSCVASPLAAHKAYHLFRSAKLQVDFSEDFHSLRDRWFEGNEAFTNGEIPQPPMSQVLAWQHQCKAFWFALPREATLLALKMGEGKSKVAIDLARNWNAARILIVAPKAAMAVWPRQFELFGSEYTVELLDKGSVKKKTKKAIFALTHTSAPIVLVINYESAFRNDFSDWAIQQNWDVIVLDESHKIKAPQGKASKFCYQLGRFAKRRLALTGTPMPHSPLDIFAQYRFLEPAIFGTSFTRFRSQYAITDPVYPSHVLNWQNQEELHDKMFQIAFRVNEDVLDLPGTTDEEIKFELSPKARRVYNDLRDEMVAQLEEGEITASNVLVKLLRLQQLTGGWAAITEGKLHQIDHGKAELLAELCDDIDAKEPIVVFCRFHSDLDAVSAAAKKLKQPYFELSGRRNDLDGPLLPDPNKIGSGYLFGVQITSGGVGVDFTHSHYAIYYSLGYSLGDYMQSRKRLDRPGQKHCVHFYHLVADNSVDQKVYAALRARKRVVEDVLHRESSDGCT